MNTTSLLPWRWKTEDDKGFVQLHQAMNELFNNFNSFSPSAEFPPMSYARSWNPRLDVAETEKEIFVTVELPGMDEKDINISLSGDQLIIGGEKREEKDEKGKTYHRIERIGGSFQRVLPLYWDVDRNNVKAIFSKGVLTISLYKTQKAQEMVRRIPVKTT